MSRLLEKSKRTTRPSKFPSAGSTNGIKRTSLLSASAARYSPLAASTIITCWRCGAAYGALVYDIHYQEEHLGDEDVHPWHYDLRSQEDQHLRDEAAYTEDSPWRYNDV